LITITTEHPLAGWSPDHVHPKGTKTDSTTRPGFNRRLYRVFPDVRLLDLGCAGGGLVKSVIDDGKTAAGIDGSDYSKNIRRAAWGTIAGSLFTADITEPFQLAGDGTPASFDVITMWEVLEHIPEPRLGRLFANVARHLADGGMVICSVSRQPDRWEGYDYHVTVHGQPWWEARLADLGWRVRPDLFPLFDPEWVRGPDNGMDSFPMVITR
jgi:SAM-dependent methyltransferase